MPISIKTMLTAAMLATFGLTSTVIANTCPTDLKRNHQGYWYSDEQPGWKAYRKTPDGVIIRADNFGGAVYSPDRHRMACVYKGSDGKWLALVSNEHHGFVIDKKATDDSGNKPAWQFSKKYQDYACGKPAINNIRGCQFQLAE